MIFINIPNYSHKKNLYTTALPKYFTHHTFEILRYCYYNVITHIAKYVIRQGKIENIFIRHNNINI